MAAFELRPPQQSTLTCTANVAQALELMADLALDDLTVNCPNQMGQCHLTRAQIMVRVAEYGRAPDQVTLGEVFDYDYPDGVARACRVD